MSRRVLILGSSGLLGRALMRHVPAEVVPLAPQQDELPLEDRPALSRFLREEAVDVLILIAAWTEVDACEADPNRAFLINGILPARLVRMAERLGLPVCYLSTDYVFDGEATRPYREFDPVRPLSVYARSKWYGECAVREASSNYRVIRSSGLFGQGGPDFVQTIFSKLRAASDRPSGSGPTPAAGATPGGPVRVVTDEINCPTWVDHLAPVVWQVALSEETGTWHAAAAGEVSRFDFARKIAELAGLDPRIVQPTTRAAFGRPAPRPAYSALDCQALREIFGLSLPSWEDGLRGFLEQMGGAR